MPISIYWFDSKDVKTIVLQSKLDSCINRISMVNFDSIRNFTFIHCLINFWVLSQLYKV